MRPAELGEQGDILKVAVGPENLGEVPQVADVVAQRAAHGGEAEVLQPRLLLEQHEGPSEGVEPERG